MRERNRDPIAVFRFAVRERDWPLAGLLAGTMGHEPATRARLECELRRAAPTEEDTPSLGALRALGRLLRVLAHRRRER